MPKNLISTVPALPPCPTECKRASDLTPHQLARESGHQQPERITQAYVGTLRAHSVLPRRSNG